MPGTESRRVRPSGDWQGFYSLSQVSRLARVPVSTLYDWKRRGIIGPSVQLFSSGLAADEGYSYADLAIIKLMRGVRNKQLSLRSLAGVLRHLFDRLGPFNSPRWQTAHIYILGGSVYAQKPDEWDTTVATAYGQKLMLRFPELFEEEATILVPKIFEEYVEINPNVMGGQPVIRNTRLPTATLAAMHQQGASYTELASLYAPLPRRTIQKAIEYEYSLDQAIASTGTAIP